jgi:hypothetical protein
MLAQGRWYLKSESDPRWDESGVALVGGFTMCPECEAALENLKKKFGEPPKDLEWSYHKY